MSNSDNVVRGGLTPKYKDTETLFQMLPYDSMLKERAAVSGTTVQSTATGSVVEYKTGFEEFRVFKVDVTGDSAPIKLNFKTFSMAVVVKGSGNVHFPSFASDYMVTESCAYYIMPEREFWISSSESLTLFIANCDI